MFSSSINTNTNVNPFLPSPPPSFLINHTDYYNDIFLHHQHNNNPLLTTPTLSFSLPTAEPPFAKANMGAATNYKTKPATTLKKDRHSKIRTAQGMRDRRVRLSIGIARKFFDLQDALGFDKASKTLEWLLTKSKTSITELTNRGGDGGGGGGPNYKTTSTTSTSECENKQVANEEEVVDISGGAPKTNKLPKPAALLHNLSKESREKARERARARTRAKKLCITKASTTPHTSSFGISDKSVAQVVEELRPSRGHSSLTNRALRADNTGDQSILIKTKLKPHPPNFAYDHQNFVTASTKDVTSIITNNNLPSLPQSWDISSAVTRSSLYAMINTNLSTEFQVYGKPWEPHNNNNQSLH